VPAAPQRLLFADRGELDTIRSGGEVTVMSNSISRRELAKAATSASIAATAVGCATPQPPAARFRDAEADAEAERAVAS
jgi:hypothetical protein